MVRAHYARKTEGRQGRLAPCRSGGCRAACGFEGHALADVEVVYLKVVALALAVISQYAGRDVTCYVWCVRGVCSCIRLCGHGGVLGGPRYSEPAVTTAAHHRLAALASRRLA
jgi:hypothetical protein